MSPAVQRKLIVVLSVALLVALAAVQYREVAERQRRGEGLSADPAAPADSQACVACHAEDNPGIVGPWRRSAHARDGVGCVDCHRAEGYDVDGYEHYGERIATVVTPRDCARCHPVEAEQYAGSAHARAARWQASDELAMVRAVLARSTGSGETGAATAASLEEEPVMAAGCAPCHGSTVAVRSTSGGLITVDDLAPDVEGRPTRTSVVAEVDCTPEGMVRLAERRWPNTGVGRRNLDGLLGSCGACHGRHEFSIRRARQPESCGVCHRGADQPQLEVFLASKHAAVLRSAPPQAGPILSTRALGRDDVPAPTCATCHLSGHSRNGWASTHDPGGRLSWQLRPIESKRRGAVPGEVGQDTWQQQRQRMRDVCLHCHGSTGIDGFYARYDELVGLINDQFTRSGAALIEQLGEQKLISRSPMDETIEWVWFDIWHRHARRARMGAAMMSPDDVHGRGLALVARGFYGDLLVRARQLAEQNHPSQGARAVLTTIGELHARSGYRGSPAPSADADQTATDDGEAAEGPPHGPSRAAPAVDDRGF